MLWPRVFYFVSGLLYPGALGAAITWFVLALGAMTRQVSDSPSVLALALALWFTSYHSLLFVRLMDRHDNWCSDPGHVKYKSEPYKHEVYGLPSLLSDIVDSLGLFAAFVALDISTGISPREYAYAFLAAMITVPVSAVLAHRGLTGPTKHQQRVRATLIVMTAAFSAAGVWVNYGLTGTEPHSATGPIILALWICLFVYVDRLYRTET